MSKLKVQNHSSKPKTELKYRCYYFSIDIINFLKTLPDKKVYWIIADQLLRSATSVGANIVEAKSSSSKRDFIKFFEISLKSANETKYWLGLLRDATDADKHKTNKLLAEIEEISKMLGSSLLTLKNKK
ncbi:MAG: four helix bundle protein [Candidatus Portnoybacteria bacterium CG02_land_8_20_14_3_00_45_8]|uniref:Four helix bundle protein n=1 Tax=Candidatus Portnoybacteria bacterium CG02_land_8_20_14_3_00_45_8 TaxID=1974807 RepID=A0A2M7D6Z0_9BACT|nr:MAG: four helix bundle protein [Candidatus Portnoybacteria bacterium CG02_land_8_20_14_3_00_45_8]